MKKIVSVVSLIFASIISMVSCANNNTGATTESQTASETNMKTALTDKKILVTFSPAPVKTTAWAISQKGIPISSQR